MKIHALLAALALSTTPALAWNPGDDPYQSPRYQAVGRDRYQQQMRQRAVQRRDAPQGYFRASPTDAEIAAAAGLDTKTGEVHNSADSLFKFELDTKATFITQTSSLKLGISATLLSLADKNDNTGFRLALDLFNDFVGAGISYVFEGTFRPALGIGYGTYLGTERTDLKARGEATESLYLTASFRLW
jgi:hypothetical protein